MEEITFSGFGNCPVCGFYITTHGDIVESEIVTCPYCESSLVIESIYDKMITLEKAPVIEEDWGE